MKVKATRTMAREIQKAMPNGYAVSVAKMGEREFAWYVDCDTYKHESDYNAGTGEFSVLRIRYPYKFHACDAYITTRDLVRIFRRSDKTLAGFLEAVRDEIEI